MILQNEARLTWGQRLLELVSLVAVVEDEGVEVSGASDLELGDSVGFGGSLGLGRSRGGVRLHRSLLDPGDYPSAFPSILFDGCNTRVASFLRAISRNCLMSLISWG